MRKTRRVIIVMIALALAIAFLPTSRAATFHSKEEHINMMKTLCDRYPEYCSYESLGKALDSNEELDWDVWLFKIGNPNGGKVLVDGQIHGNEDWGSEVIYRFATWVLESGESRAKAILKGNYLLFVPVITHSYDRSNPNTASCRYGVNLDRNFETGWSTGEGCSSAQNYPGPYALSEKESQALTRAFDEYRPDYYLNLHQGAGPCCNYYNGQPSSLVQPVISKVNEIGNEMGITPYSMRSWGSQGWAIGDAYEIYGAKSWKLEIVNHYNSGSSDWQTFIDTWYPKCFIMLLSLCELCEVEDAWSPEEIKVNILSGGSISYAPSPPPPPSSDALFGWGGFVRTYDSVTPMLDQLQQDGWNIVRYYSVPQWAQAIGYGGFDINHEILRHLIEEAKNRDMYVLLNIAHNFPPGPFIDDHQDDWINEYLADLQAIDAIDYDNLLFDLANEYTGTQSNIIAHYNAMIAALRDAGYTQPCLLSYWWDHDIGYCTSQIVDPLDNFMVGMHFYAQSNNFDDYNTPGTFTEVCQDSGIEDYFQNWLWPEKIQPVLDQGIEFLCGEIGSGWDYKYTRGGVAFPMRFLQLAQEDDRVHVIMHSAPSCCYDYDDYYGQAQEYWGMDFW